MPQLGLQSHGATAKGGEIEPGAGVNKVLKVGGVELEGYKPVF